MTDEKFEEKFIDEFGSRTEEWFYSKIAGMTHPNRDGSNRVEFLAYCEPLDHLDISPEPDNPVDPKAVAIYLGKTGSQLGYLPERTAHDLLARMESEPGSSWFAVFRAPYKDDSGHHIVGATIIVARNYVPHRRG